MQQIATKTTMKQKSAPAQDAIMIKWLIALSCSVRKEKQNDLKDRIFLLGSRRLKKLLKSFARPAELTRSSKFYLVIDVD